jgi:hypothetical protein
MFNRGRGWVCSSAPTAAFRPRGPHGPGPVGAFQSRGPHVRYLRLATVPSNAHVSSHSSGRLPIPMIPPRCVPNALAPPPQLQEHRIDVFPCDLSATFVRRCAVIQSHANGNEGVRASDGSRSGTEVITNGAHEGARRVTLPCTTSLGTPRRRSSRAAFQIQAAATPHRVRLGGTCPAIDRATRLGAMTVTAPRAAPPAGWLRGAERADRPMPRGAYRA